MNSISMTYVAYEFWNIDYFYVKLFSLQSFTFEIKIVQKAMDTSGQ